MTIRFRHWAIPAAFALLFAAGAAAQDDAIPAGAGVVQTIQDALERENIPTTLAVVFLITIIALAPSILVMTTCFTRIIVVFGFLRQALATQQTPPNQVLIGMALILTFFVMLPTYVEVNERAIQPYIAGEIEDTMEAIETGLEPIRNFMFRQTRPQDIKLFLDIGGYDRPETPDDVPTHVLVPAFIISELSTAFMIGFIIYIPFLIIDMVVASTLMAMGMMMLPPIFVSLPFKIIMFVLVDGWSLLIGSLVRSFN